MKPTIYRNEEGDYALDWEGQVVLSWNDEVITLIYPEVPEVPLKGCSWDMKIRNAVNKTAADCRLGFRIFSKRDKRILKLTDGRKATLKLGKQVKFPLKEYKDAKNNND